MGPPFDPSTTATRRFGRFELRALLGRSTLCMAWRAHDPRSAQDLVLVLPRRQPAGAAALAEALDEARRAARLQHPHLAHAVEVGEQERWPYIAYDAAGPTLAERKPAANGEALAAARCVADCATALAFAHDGGHAHNDLQPWLISVGDSGAARLMGLGLLPALLTPLQPSAADGESAEQRLRRGAREAAENDVLALAIVLHGLLAGAPALGEPDIGAALLRLAPAGREPIRLPWDVPRPIPEVLRAIANRATDRQVRQRFRNARTLARALEGWLLQESDQGDAHAQLIERVRQLGVLPALPGAAARAARLALMERQHTEELAEIVMRDAALTLELLRAVNSAQVRGTQVSGNGAVLTVRRAIAMIGLDGVRRSALAMRHWPGPLDAAGAAELELALAAAQRAARLAQALRPAGYDAEMAALVALLQNLGRLVLQYHQPEEMRQVRRLMQPAAAAEPGQPDQPGMSEQAAGFAVLGADIDSMAQAVARWMGLGSAADDTVLQLMRRLPLDKPVRSADSDDEVLRALASAANEAIDALALPPAHQSAAIERVAKRYARALHITARDLTAALQASAKAMPAAEAVA